MKFDWKELFEWLQLTSVCAAIGAVLVVFLVSVSRCQMESDKISVLRTKEEARTLQICIEKTAKHLECREMLKDLY